MTPRFFTFALIALALLPTRGYGLPLFGKAPESSCAANFAQLLKSSSPNAEAIKKAFFAAHPNPTSQDLISALSNYAGGSAYKRNLLEAVAPRLSELDGPSLARAAALIPDQTERATAMTSGFASIKNPRATDLEAAVRGLQGSSAYQRALVQKYAIAISDLDGAMLAKILANIQDQTSRNDAAMVGFKAIQNPKGNDLFEAVRALRGSSAYQTALIKNHASQISDLNGKNLVDAINAIEVKDARGEAMTAGFAALRSYNADELVSAIKALSGQSAYQRQLVEKYAAGSGNLTGEKLAEAARSIGDDQSRVEAVLAGARAIKSPTADDLLESVQTLAGKNSKAQGLIVERMALEITDLTGEKLASIANAIGNNEERTKAVMTGFAAIRQPTQEDLNSAVTSLGSFQGAKNALISRETSRLVAKGARPSVAPITSAKDLAKPTKENLETAVRALKGRSAYDQADLIKTLSPKIPDLDCPTLLRAVADIEDANFRLLAINDGFAALTSPTADDLVAASKLLFGIKAEDQRAFIEKFAPKVSGLNGAKLAESVWIISDATHRPMAVVNGFASIKNPTKGDLDAAVDAFSALSWDQKNHYSNELSGILNASRKTAPTPEVGSVAPATATAKAAAGPAPIPSGSAALDDLKAMPGMEKITDQLGTIRELLAVNKQREAEGLKVVTPMLHARFDGNPGTGKTTVARLYGKMLHELGFLKKGAGKDVPVIEHAGTDFVGPDAVEKMKKAIADAQGGVLILDELYAANPAKSQYAKDASAVLLKAMEDQRDKFVVISTGYQKEMDEFISSNDGFKRRFVQKLNFEDYGDATLDSILKKFVRENDYQIDDKVAASVIQKLGRERGKGFGNAGSVRNTFEAAAQRHAARIAKKPSATKEELKTLTLEDFHPPAGSIEEKLAILDKMAGLEEVKKSVRSVVSLLKLEESRAAHGLKSDRPLLNAVFEGNPGTGKTTVARLYGSMLKDLGYISKGEFIEVKASDLIGDVVGASETKTRELLKRAKGSVLFIDESYLLYRPDAGGSSSFGRAALDTLVSEINADANQDMVVILAGYPREMANMMSANAGLTRRFPRNFNFTDYNAEQLGHILAKKVKDKGFELTPEAEKAAVAELNLRRAARDFGNAGEVENLLGSAQLRQSERLAQSGKSTFDGHELKTLLPEDFKGPRVSPESVLGELDKLPGLSAVKNALRDIKDTNEEAALADQSMVLDAVYGFRGNSPEDQTKVAETLGNLLHAQGVLPKNSLEVADATDLKGQYQGESAVKTKRVLEAALGKTLFVKGLNAISNPQHPYEKEILDTMTSFLQQNRGKMAVVFSGTPEELERFARLNPKLGRMIEQEMDFEELKPAEGVKYLEKLFGDSGKSVSPAALVKLNEYLPKLLEEEGWGNTGNLDQLKAKIMIKQAVRAKRAPDADPKLIDAADIEAAMPNNLLRRAPAATGPSAHADPAPAGNEGFRERNAPAEQAQVATARRAEAHEATKPHEENAVTHKHAEHEGKGLASVGIPISDRAQKLMLGMQDLLNPNDPSTIANVKEAIKRGKLDQPLLEQLAKKLNEGQDPASLARLNNEAENAIQEYKEGAKLLKEKAKTDEKAKTLIKHYVCLACGRSTCNYMPYTWFTEE